MQTVSSSDIFANVGRTDEAYVDSQTPTLMDLDLPLPTTSYKVLKLILTRDREEKIHSLMSLSWNYGWNFLENMVSAGDDSEFSEICSIYIMKLLH